MAKKKRDQVKHPGLKKGYNSRVRQEYMDQDYVKDLTEEQKSWLSDFNSEYYGADLDFKNLKNNLHNTKKLKKDCTDRNNAQNRCAYGIAKAGNRINDVNTFTEIQDAINIDLGPDDEIHSDPDIENALIEFIDSKKKPE